MNRGSRWLALVVCVGVVILAAINGHLNARLFVALPLIPFAVYMNAIKWAAIRRREEERRR